MKDIKKKLILLDLDNTIICSEDLDRVKDHEKLLIAKEKFRNVKMKDYYDIFERPNLQSFLDFLFKHFDVGVWTASSKDYAIFVTKNFITNPNEKECKERKIKIFLCSHHCNLSKKYYKGVSKNLKLISEKLNMYKPKDIFLLDDLEDLAEHQPDNILTIKPFFYDDNQSYEDKELLQIQNNLEKLLNN